MPYNKSPITTKGQYDKEDIKQMMLKSQIQAVPVVNSENKPLSSGIYESKKTK